MGPSQRIDRSGFGWAGSISPGGGGFLSALAIRLCGPGGVWFAALEAFLGSTGGETRVDRRKVSFWPLMTGSTLFNGPCGNRGAHEDIRPDSIGNAGRSGRRTEQLIRSQVFNACLALVSLQPSEEKSPLRNSR